jgi:hypothetical protein
MVKAEGWDIARGESKMPSKWTTLPDIMGRYRSAMFLGRLYCPEVLLGLPTDDELHDVAGAERAVAGERVEDPIELPRAIAQDPAAPAPPAEQRPPLEVDPGTGEVNPITPAQHAKGEAGHLEAQATPDRTQPILTPASKAQREMVVKIAASANVSAGAVDGELVDKFAFVLADMPAEMFNDVLAHFKTLAAQRAR